MYCVWLHTVFMSNGRIMTSSKLHRVSRITLGYAKKGFEHHIMDFWKRKEVVGTISINKGSIVGQNRVSSKLKRRLVDK